MGKKIAHTHTAIRATHGDNFTHNVIRTTLGANAKMRITGQIIEIRLK